MMLEAIRARCRIDEDGCWIWRGSVNSYESPRMTVRGRQTVVARHVLALVERKPGASHFVSARCGKPRCVNPACLQARTRSAVMRAAKQTLPLAVRLKIAHAMRARSPIDAATVRAIRAASDAGASRTQLARAHGVSVQTVSKIARRERHAELGPWTGLR